MRIAYTQDLNEAELQELLWIWNKVYPKEIACETINDFRKYIGKLSDPTHLLALDGAGRIKGWLSLFTRAHEPWFLIIIHPESHHKGLGTRLLSLAKTKTSVLNGWVVPHNNYENSYGEAYLSPIAFYEKNGFKILHEVKSSGGDIETVKIEWHASP